MVRLKLTTLLTAILALAWLSGRAQTQSRLHLQSYTYSEMHALGEDSLFMPVYLSRDNRMAILDVDSAHWTIRNDSVLPQLPRQLAMADSRNGIAAAINGDLMITQNGWRTAEIVPGGASFVHRHATGYIAGRYHTGRYRFHHSPDGRTWTVTPMELRSDEGNSMSGKYVISGQLGSPWYSTDGAVSFQNLTRNNLPNFGQMQSYKLIGADTILVVAQNGLFVSNDLGLTYTQRTLPAAPRTGAINWANSKVGAYHVETPTWGLYFTLDGGQNWIHPATLPFQRVSSIFRHGNYWYVQDGSQQIFRTSDNGATFQLFVPGYENAVIVKLFDVDFAGKFGVSVGEGGHFAISTDGGRYFTMRTKPTTEDLFAVGIAPNGNVYAGDRKGQVWASADRGITWQNKLTNTITNLIAAKFFFSNDGRMVLMQRAGQPVLSKDTGRTFNFVPGFGGNHVFSLKPQSGTMIGAALEGNGLGPKMEVYSVDPSNSQRTRLALINDEGMQVVALHMVNDNVGYLVTSMTSPTPQTRVYRTTDGWQTVAPYSTIPPTHSFFSSGGITIQDFGPQTLILNENGREAYVKTTDGGQTWLRVDVPIDIAGLPQAASYRPYFFTPDKYIYPMDGRIFFLNSFADGTTPSPAAIGPVLGKATASLSLYPNPARDEVRFDLARKDFNSGNTQAIVLDMAGRRLLSAEARSGSISLSTLKPGLYQLVLMQNGRLEGRGAFIKE